MATERIESQVVGGLGVGAGRNIFGAVADQFWVQVGHEEAREDAKVGTAKFAKGDWAAILDLAGGECVGGSRMRGGIEEGHGELLGAVEVEHAAVVATAWREGGGKHCGGVGWFDGRCATCG